MKNFTEFTNDFGTKQFILLGFLIFGGIGWYASSAYFGNESAKLEQARSIEEKKIAAEVSQLEADKAVEQSKIEAEKDIVISKEHGTWLPWSKKEE
tara:strand:+ start:2456 stop:2743 length:288 start_codon:yes stop_codon:yes gene_type:complete